MNKKSFNKHKVNKDNIDKKKNENVTNEAETIAEYAQFILNQKNAFDFCRLPFKERRMLNMGVLWHQICIHNVNNANREVVLKDILNAVHPYDLIPVNYKVDGPNAYFMARNCGSALEKLCQDNLIVKASNDSCYILTLKLGFSDTTKTQLNVQTNIQDTITKRFNASNKVLNLDNFHKDTDLSELIFCTLSQPKILYFVLYLSKPFQMHSLKLSNNEIRNLTPLEVLWTCKTLTSLDLRNNYIDNMVALSPLKNMKITELWLDGNPVCTNYDEIYYVQAVKEVCPTIEKLDGMMVGTKGFLAYRRNFVVHPDCQQLVDQFLSHFFNLYDSRNREYLEGLYKKNAIFTMSCSFLPSQSTSPSVKLENYKKYARNLIKMIDFSKSCQELIEGNQNIIDRICRFPNSEHDPYTFTVDVVHFTPESIVLIVTGAFREPAKSLSEFEGIYGFSRTFVLQGIENGEYVICNEMLHITNATTSLANRAFKIVKVGGPKNIQPGLYVVDSEYKSEVIMAFRKITGLNKLWGRKCLEDEKWDFKRALETFVELYKSEQIPAVAFKSSQEFP